MKRILVIAMLAILGGCAIYPAYGPPPRYYGGGGYYSHGYWTR